jgi:hypothetical protein
MSDDTENEYESVDWTAEDHFWRDWLQESPKLNLAILRDLLTKAITLSAGLSLGTAAFLDKSHAEPTCAGLAIVLFFVGLIICCVGVFPQSENVPPELNAMKKAKECAIWRMKSFLISAGAVISLGFFFVVLGWFLRLINQQ